MGDMHLLQGPYNAGQLLKLLTHGIVPDSCAVLIDLAALGSISVTTPAAALKPLLSQPACLSRGQPHLHELPGLLEAPRAPKPVRNPRNGDRDNGRGREKNTAENGKDVQGRNGTSESAGPVRGRRNGGMQWSDDTAQEREPPSWRRRLGADVAHLVSAIIQCTCWQ
jgi:hypothetical protein